MDGTLVDSTAGVVGAWTAFAKTYPGIDVHEILSCEGSFIFFNGAYFSAKRCGSFILGSHGVRTVDNLRQYCKLDDPDELEVSPIRQPKHRLL